HLTIILTIYLFVILISEKVKGTFGPKN
ncbi:MAG: hypothetical protein RLZZ595_1773, partial [Bacteroidota bacterium]